MNQQVINIEECPICGNGHRYLLEIKKSYVMGNLPSYTAEFDSEKKFTLLVICPTLQEEYQIQLTVKESLNEKIEDLIANLFDGDKKNERQE